MMDRGGYKTHNNAKVKTNSLLGYPAQIRSATPAAQPASISFALRTRCIRIPFLPHYTKIIATGNNDWLEILYSRNTIKPHSLPLPSSILCTIQCCPKKHFKKPDRINDQVSLVISILLFCFLFRKPFGQMSNLFIRDALSNRLIVHRRHLVITIFNDGQNLFLAVLVTHTPK